MLLSYVVDSAIELSTELGDYDHLVFTNPKWIENFGDSGKLKPIEYSSLSKSMQEFLDSQMTEVYCQKEQGYTNTKVAVCLHFL